MSSCPRRLIRLFPECLSDGSHGTLVLGALGRWERPAPILAHRSCSPTEPRCPFHPPLRDRYSGQPLQAPQDGKVLTYPPSQLQALFVQPPSQRVFTCLALDAPEAGERARDAPGVLLAARQSKALFQQHSRAYETPLLAHRVPQGAKAPGDAESGGELAGQYEGLLLQAHRAFVVSQLVGHKSELAERSALPFLVAHLPVHANGLFVQRHRALVVSLHHGQDAAYVEQTRLRAGGQLALSSSGWAP